MRWLHKTLRYLCFPRKISAFNRLRDFLVQKLLFSQSVMSDSHAPWTAACQASLSFTISWSLLKLMSLESVMPSNQLILCCSLLLLPSFFPSIKVFSSQSALCIMWPKYWSFSFSISPSNEWSGPINFMTDWIDLLAIQGTLKSLLQHYSSKASGFRCSTFFMVQLTHPYMSTGKTIALNRWAFVGKVMSLLFKKNLFIYFNWRLITPISLAFTIFDMN